MRVVAVRQVSLAGERLRVERHDVSVWIRDEGAPARERQVELVGARRRSVGDGRQFFAARLAAEREHEHSGGYGGERDDRGDDPERFDAAGTSTGGGPLEARLRWRNRGRGLRG